MDNPKPEIIQKLNEARGTYLAFLQELDETQ